MVRSVPETRYDVNHMIVQVWCDVELAKIPVHLRSWNGLISHIMFRNTGYSRQTIATKLLDFWRRRTDWLIQDDFDFTFSFYLTTLFWAEKSPVSSEVERSVPGWFKKSVFKWKFQLTDPLSIDVLRAQKIPHWSKLGVQPLVFFIYILLITP